MNPIDWNRNALLAVAPAALSAYARSLGWTKSEQYGNHSDVYSSDELPEIILPRTQRLGDYASVVLQLIRHFSDATDMDLHSTYRDLVTADRDLIRVRAPSDEDDGSIPVNDGVELVDGAHEMLLAAACSLPTPQPVYRAGANKRATEYLRRVRLGQTEHGSYVITLVSPAILPPTQGKLFSDESLYDDPFERQVTRRLADALVAVQSATERTVTGEFDAFSASVVLGVSANLCEALARLIDPVGTLDVSVSWARTYPRATGRDIVRFASGDVPILKEAARSFRSRSPEPDAQVFGIIWKLTRAKQETEGTITMHAPVGGEIRSITAVLSQLDYERAIQAHKTKSPVIASGDLERVDQRWRLLNPRIEEIILRAEGDTEERD